MKNLLLLLALGLFCGTASAQSVNVTSYTYGVDNPDLSDEALIRGVFADFNCTMSVITIFVPNDPTKPEIIKSSHTPSDGINVLSGNGRFMIWYDDSMYSDGVLEVKIIDCNDTIWGGSFGY